MGFNPVSAVVDLVKEGVGYYRDTRKAKHDLKKAGLENRARLLRDEMTNNHEWEMQSLEDKDKWIRRTSFFAFILPFVVAIFSPEAVRQYFDVALASIPEWWKNAYIAITGAIWGISSMKTAAGQILGTAASLFKNKNNKD